MYNLIFRTSSEELKPDLTRSKKNSVPCKQYTKLNMPDKVKNSVPCKQYTKLNIPDKVKNSVLVNNILN